MSMSPQKGRGGPRYEKTHYYHSGNEIYNYIKATATTSQAAATLDGIVNHNIINLMLRPLHSLGNTCMYLQVLEG